MGSTYKSKLEDVNYIPQTSYEGVNSATRNAVALFNKASDNAMKMGQTLVKMGEVRAADARKLAAQKAARSGSRSGGGGGGRKKSGKKSKDGNKDSAFIDMMTKQLGDAKKPIVMMTPKAPEKEPVVLNNRLTEEGFRPLPYEDGKTATSDSKEAAASTSKQSSSDVTPIMQVEQPENTQDVASNTGRFSQYLDKGGAADTIISADATQNPTRWPAINEDPERQNILAQAEQVQKDAGAIDKGQEPQSTQEQQGIEDTDIYGTERSDTNPLVGYAQKRNQEFNEEAKAFNAKNEMEQIQKEANARGEFVFFVNGEKERKIVAATAKRDYLQLKLAQDTLKISAAYKKHYGNKKNVPKSILNALLTKTKLQYDAAKQEAKTITESLKKQQSKTELQAFTQAKETEKAKTTLLATEAAKRNQCDKLDPTAKVQCLQIRKNNDVYDRRKRKDLEELAAKKKSNYRSKHMTPDDLKYTVSSAMNAAPDRKGWSWKTEDLYNKLIPWRFDLNKKEMNTLVKELKSNDAYITDSTVAGDATLMGSHFYLGDSGRKQLGATINALAKGIIGKRKTRIEKAKKRKAAAAAAANKK